MPDLEMQKLVSPGLRRLRQEDHGVTRPVTALGLVDVSAGTTSLLESWMHVQPLRHQLPLSNCKS